MVSELEENNEPPDTNRDRLQPAGTGRLPSGALRGLYARSFPVVFVCHSVGSKFGLGLHNSLGLYSHDETNS